MRIISVFILTILFACPNIRAQDNISLYDKMFNMPDKFFNAVNEKSEKFQEQTIRATEKYLDKLQKQELKMQKRLAKKDSTAAKELFGNIKERYDGLRKTLNGTDDKLQKVYSRHLDSISTSLHFLNANQLIKGDKMQEVLGKYGNVQGKLNQTEFIYTQLKERQQQLKNNFEKLGLTKQFRKYQEQIYYYRAQMDAYKKIFEDPEKLERAVLGAMSKIPAFQEFFSRYSQLAGIFQLPGNTTIDPAMTNQMQTRDMIMQSLQDRMGSGAMSLQTLNGNIASAQSAMQPLKNKLSQLGDAGGDAEMPRFKPNNEKSKSFWKRIELGFNAQSVKSNLFFPTTTDFGASVGYKINSRSTIGIGCSYKVGWGKDFKHINITHEGVGLRSYADIKLKGSFFVSGGMEYNYQQPFSGVQQINDLKAWQQSGLIGISKTVALKSRTFKKTKAQLLWDFLSYRQRPVSPAIKFRIGYTLQ